MERSGWLVYSRPALTNIEPTQFGDKYVLVEHIATGGMAEIYRAQYAGIEGFAKEVVVKRLREKFAERDDVVEMFLDEARIAATLTHRNVVHTYDLGEIEGEYFIAMEYLQGCELIEILKASGRTGTVIPHEIAIGVVMQSLEGLSYVHERADDEGSPLGLIHRDLNPTNIHVGFDGVCKIVDFGIAATRTKALEGAGRFAGKLSYMAPEQVEGGSLDARADLFAMGVMLYEMTLRRRLFRGDAATVRERLLSGEIDPPTVVDPEYPPALEAIIMRALEVDPEDRFRSADQFFMALESFVEESGLVASARRISAFMADLDIEGAVALASDEEGEFDDLGDDEALDFGEFEAGAHGGTPPSWVTEASDLPETDGRDGRGRGRTMTLASLTSMVEQADVTEDDASSVQGASGSSMHAIVREEIADEASSPMTTAAAGSKLGAARRTSGPHGRAGDVGLRRVTVPAHPSASRGPRAPRYVEGRAPRDRRIPANRPARPGRHHDPRLAPRPPLRRSRSPRSVVA